MKTIKRNLRKGMALVTLALFMSQSIGWAAEPALNLTPQGYQAVKTPGTEAAPVIPQQKISDLSDLEKPLIAAVKMESSKPEKEARDFEEYEFEEAIEHLQADKASAVIVKALNSRDLRKLTELNFETGIAVLKGKIVLFTSGNEEEIRMLPAAEEMLKEASLLAHVHPAGEMTKPSSVDIEAAGEMTEYVISSEGVYAFNRDGLKEDYPADYGAFCRTVNKLNDDAKSSKEARDILNRFIKAVDDYNEEKDSGQLWRSALTETMAPSNARYSFVQNGTVLYLKDKTTGSATALATLTADDTVSSFDVDPSGKYAFFNVTGMQYSTHGYTKIFNIAAKALVSAVNPATGQPVSQINGVLYSAAATQTPSAFKFVEGFALFSFHSGGYNPPTGGIILNLNKTPVWITQTGVISTSNPVVMTPQKDKLLFSSSLSGLGIYDVATGRVDYQSAGSLIKAVTADGEWAITGSVENVVYAVSIRNLNRPVRSITVPVPCPKNDYPCWSGRTAYAVNTVSPNGTNLFDATLMNNEKVILYLDNSTFRIEYPFTLLPTSSIVPLPVNSLGRTATATTVAPSGAVATNVVDDRGNTFTYQTGAGGWAGTGFTYDDFSTTAIETGDLSKVTNVMFGLKRGNPAVSFAGRVKIEMVDAAGNKASFYMEGIGDVEKVWSLPAIYFTNAGVDLTKVRMIYFIVEGQNLNGALQINQYPFGSSQPKYTNSSAEITRLSGNPSNNTVIPSGAYATMTATSRGAVLSYNSGIGGWVGGGFNYDNFSTPAIETANLNEYQSLVFGLKGAPSRVKVEIIDDQNRKAVVYLTKVSSSQENEWAISMTALKSANLVDLTKVRMIYFIIEGLHQTGTLEINRIPTPIVGSAAAAITPLPSVPRNVTVAPNGAIAAVASISRGISFRYGTSSAGWAGAGFSFDDPSTPAVESANLTSSMTFGLKGNPTTVKFEVVDSLGRKASVQLTGIRTDAELRWTIPAAVLASYGIDLTRITTIYFIVEGVNQSGTLEIYRI